jgi:hypothetical protein
MSDRTEEQAGIRKKVKNDDKNPTNDGPGITEEYEND